MSKELRAESRKCFLWILCSMLYALCFLPSAEAAGTTGADFLKVPVGARNVAMGEVGATSMDVNAAYWNPSGLAFLKSGQVSLMYHRSFDQVTYQYAAFAYPFSKKIGSLAASITYAGIPDLTAFDAKGNPAPPITASDMAVSAGYGRKIFAGDKTTLSGGFNLKMVQSKLHTYSATAQAVDFGFMAYSRNLFKKDSMFKAGLSISNIGGKMKFIQTAASLPLTVRFGIGQEQKVASRPLNLEADINLTPEGGRTLGVGAEYLVKNFISLRAGAKSGEKGAGPATKLTGGLGLDLFNFKLDYSLTAAGQFGMLHRFGLIFTLPTRTLELTEEQKAALEKFYEQGINLYNDERFAEAILMFNKVIKKYPAHREAFEMMRKAYEKIKKTENNTLKDVPPSNNSIEGSPENYKEEGPSAPSPEDKGDGEESDKSDE